VSDRDWHGIVTLIEHMRYMSRPELYDLEYSFKDYAGEAALLERIIDDRHPEARTLLDVACGTGRHLEHLRGRFDCEGVDIDEELLRVARNRLPDIPFQQADMRDFDLGREFDVVTCLFSAIGFVGGPDGLTATAGTFARHLGPGGLALVEPWLTPDVWVLNRPHLLSYEEPELVLARATVSGLRDERVSTTEMHYVVATPAGVEHFVEHHDLYLFTHEEMRSAFEAAGLTVEHDPQGLIGRGLWICSRPG
jgi:SAM-dependent methyltransferase